VVASEGVAVLAFVRSLAPIVFISALAGCGDGGQDLSFRFPGGIPDGEAENIATAAKTLLSACPGIHKYWKDLSQGSDVIVGVASQSDARELGWKTVAHFEFIVSDYPQAIPLSYHAAGHHCHYAVGIEPPFGVSIAKSPCIAICADKPATESNSFAAASGLN
jgi:hypothetical protein